MGRIRTLKPGFFRSESLSRCSIEARVTFAGLWTEADDAGRGDATPRLLATALWPWDNPTDEQVSAWLAELVATDHIVIYEHRGKSLFQVLRWDEHQSAAFRRGTSTFPEPPKSGPCTPLQDSARGGVQESAGQTRQDKTGRGEDKEQTGPHASSTHAESVVSQSVDIYAEHVYATEPGKCKTTPVRYKAGIARNALDEHGATLREYVVGHPDADAYEVARAVLNVPQPKRREWYADEGCPLCGGDGLANLAPEGAPAAYAPCTCRRSEPYEREMAPVIDLQARLG